MSLTTTKSKRWRNYSNPYKRQYWKQTAHKGIIKGLTCTRCGYHFFEEDILPNDECPPENEEENPYNNICTTPGMKQFNNRIKEITTSASITQNKADYPKSWNKQVKIVYMDPSEPYGHYMDEPYEPYEDRPYYRNNYY